MAKLSDSQWIQLKKLYIEGKDEFGQEVSITKLSQLFKISRKTIYFKKEEDLKLLKQSGGKIGLDWDVEKSNYANGIKSAVLRVSEEEIKNSMFPNEPLIVDVTDISKSPDVVQQEYIHTADHYVQTQSQIQDSKNKGLFHVGRTKNAWYHGS